MLNGKRGCVNGGKGPCSVGVGFGCQLEGKACVKPQSASKMFAPFYNGPRSIYLYIKHGTTEFRKACLCWQSNSQTVTQTRFDSFSPMKNARCYFMQQEIILPGQLPALVTCKHLKTTSHFVLSELCLQEPVNPDKYRKKFFAHCFILQSKQSCSYHKRLERKNKLEMLGSIVSRLAHYDPCVNLSTLCKRQIFWQGTC